MRYFLVGLCLVSLAFGADACGVPFDSSARPINTQDFPIGVLPAVTSTVPSATDQRVEIFLSDGHGLVAVFRPAARLALRDSLQALLAGPSDGDRLQALTTAINPQTRIRAAQVSGTGVASVDLSREFVDVPFADELLAVAQLVYTASAVPGVTAVHFAVDGQAIDVPSGDGTLVERPVARQDYPERLTPA